MTDLQKLELRAGEIRQRLAGIGGMETQTDETRAELSTLRTEYQDNEGRQMALRIAGDTPDRLETRSDPQGRELRALMGRANLGLMVDSSSSTRSFEGANAELQQHYGLGGSQVPLAMLRDWEGSPLETRAVTPAPSDVGAVQQSIVPYVFPMAAAAFLGVEMPMVGVGRANLPRAHVEAVRRGAGRERAGTETTGAFSANQLSPSRLQASFFYSARRPRPFREHGYGAEGELVHGSR